MGKRSCAWCQREKWSGAQTSGPQLFMAWLTVGLLPGLTLLDRPEAVRQAPGGSAAGPSGAKACGLSPESGRQPQAWHQPSLSLALVKSRAAAAIPVSGGGRALWLMGPGPLQRRPEWATPWPPPRNRASRTPDLILEGPCTPSAVFSLGIPPAQPASPGPLLANSWT